MLYLPKDINHSQPTQIVSYFFVKVPADRFHNSQCYHPDEVEGLSDNEIESLHYSPQFWYSKDCETEEDYLKKKAADSLLDLHQTADTSSHIVNI